MTEESMPGATGRLLGTNNLNRAVDAVERTVTRLATSVERALPTIERGVAGASAVTSGVRSGGSWKPMSGNKPNGGGATFGGQISAGQTEFPNPGKYRAEGPAQITGGPLLGPGGGARRGSGNGVAATGFVAGAAYSMGRSINANVGHNLRESADDSRLMLNYGQYYGMGSGNSYKSMFSGWRMAQDTKDLVGAGTQISLQGGALAGSARWKGLMAQAGTSAIINPFMSATQAAQYQTSMMSPQGYNKMRLVGINTRVGGQVKSPIQIAQSILSQTGLATRKLNAEEIAFAIDDPMSNVNQTLSNWVSHGIISPDQMAVTKENMRAILLARQKGVGANSLDKMARAATSSNGSTAQKANSALKALGINRTQLQGDKDLESSKRESSVQRLEGFEKGLEKSTSALTSFHKQLNAITGNLGPLNTVTGFMRGVGENGKLGGGLGMLSMIPGAGMIASSGMTGVSNLAGAVTGLFGGGGAVTSSMGIGSAGGPLDGASTGYVAGGGAVAGGMGSTSAPGPTAGSNRTSGLYGGVKPHVARAGKEIEAKFRPASVGGVGPRSNASDHPKGLALDFMVYKDKRKGDAIAGYVAANKGRLGVTYIIWYKRIMHTGSNKWSAYTHPSGSSSVTLDHMDHVHVSFSSKDPGSGGNPNTNYSPTSFSGSTGGVGGGGKGSASDFGVGTNSSSTSMTTTTRAASGGVAAMGVFSESATIDSALAGGLSRGMGATSTTITQSSDSATSYGGVGAGRGKNGYSKPGSSTSGGVSLVNPGTYTKDGITYYADSNGNFSKDAQAHGAPANTGGLGSGGSVTGNRAIGQKMAAARGWTGANWNALLTLWNNESGWRTEADNPTSSAYGIPQALIANRNMPKGYYSRKTGSGANTHAYGGDPATQIRWGLDYIAGRYGSPANAWKFWKSHHWYDKGAWEIQQDGDARVHKGEMVVPANQARQIREVLLNNNSYGSNSAGGGSGIVLQFNQGSIVLSVGAGVTPGAGKAVAKEFVDALASNDRIVALQTGRRN